MNSIRKKLLVRFLKENNIYNRYKDNVNFMLIPKTLNQIIEKVEEQKYYDYGDEILISFNWYETGEGAEFWTKVDKKWRFISYDYEKYNNKKKTIHQIP